MRFKLTGTIGPVGAGSIAGIAFAVPGASFPWQAGVQIANYPSNPSTAELPNALTSCFITDGSTIDPSYTHTQAGAVAAASFEISAELALVGGVFQTTLQAETPFGSVSRVIAASSPPLLPLPTFCFHCEGPAAAIGAVQFDCRGSLRDYADWTDLSDFSYPEGATVAVSGGLLTGTGLTVIGYGAGQYLASAFLTSPDLALHWTPLLHGPAILQALAGYPVWRWRWQRNAATRYADAVCERNGGDGAWEEQAAPWTIAAGQQTPTGLAAWMTDDGHAWTVSTLPYAGGAAAGTLQIFSPSTGYALGTSPLGAMSMGEQGWDPVAARLWPSNDVLIVWIDAHYNLAATRCPYRVSSTTGAVSYVDDETETVSVGVQALATGGIWNDDTGRLYLSYLDLDGVMQLIISDDGGETWAASE